ncbi:hypothetical protein HPB47_007208 [Ixodes persulcatus]|uniref:Uncharacterized protein n=1 Tax=Ixodes persulcatus TaxID=34615 RepID=A0AC60P8L6_IXOPE|nr:hypothetical protein HPB47_007208 [Ixodes persulcatus]
MFRHRQSLSCLHKPKVELTLGSHPRQWNIVEGHDLYLECRVDANPRIGDVLWRLDGRDLHPGRHVIMSNQSLALQSVRRDSSGSYTCVATNRVGETQSEPLNIVVKHSPACNQSQTTVYAASRHEEVHVICDVASEPKDVKFRWTFNNSATKHDVTSFTSSGTRSVLYYTARKDSDYGTFQCLANNSVGEMKTPCYFQIVPAGPLNTMYHCAVTNITDVGLQVDCQRKDGTTVGAQEGAMLPDDVAAEASTFRQRHGFQLEVRDLLLDRVLFNSTSEMASFTVTNLPPGTSCVLALYLVNQQGRSKVVQLRTSTLLPSEEKLRSATKKREPSTSPENAELNEMREPGPESKFVIPVVKQCAKELPASRENGLTYVSLSTVTVHGTYSSRKISQLVLLVCVVLITSTEGGFYGEGERHVYAGAEDYPPGFVISTLRSEEDKHGHEQRGYGHGHRDYVNEPEYVVRSPYGALLQQAESHSQFYGGGVGPIGHDHVGFYGTGVREDYLMAR